MTLRNIFIENLKFYRKKSGLSQQQLAEKCDMATNYLSEIERGQKFPSIEMIEHISTAIKIPAYLLFLDGKTAARSNLVTKKRDSEFCENLLSTISEMLKEYGFRE